MSEKFIPPKMILDFFALLAKNKIDFRLIKNISGELPSSLKNGKDIDILVNPKQKQEFASVMSKNNFLLRTHPYGKENGWHFLYQVPPCQFWQLNTEKITFYIDVSFMMMCKSLAPKSWVPLNKPFQDAAFENSKWNENLGCFQIEEKTAFAYKIVRCVFDKRGFPNAYINEIKSQKKFLQDEKVRSLLEAEFFKFTPRLISLLQNDEYESICKAYISFSDY